MEEAIRVCIRQRPLFQREIDAGHVKAWKLEENGSLTLEITPPQGIPIKKAYAFDICFDDNCTNEQLFDKTAKDIVRDTAKGINGCYMAYGQTGCGKTHSIMGTASDPGVLPRSIAELFDIIEDGTAGGDDKDCETEFLLRVSYVEIYLERVNDLFQDGPKGETQPLENLDVKEDPKGGFFVVGIAEREVSSIEDVMKLLQSAEMKRHFARTNFNETSSRSHTVFTTSLESTQLFSDGASITRKGELKLVDLAGNERASAAEGVEGAKERQAEGQAINKSLFLLSEVIAKLSKKADLLKKGAGSAAAEKLKKEIMHIPWRDSKLTRLLQKALGGNSRACLLVAVHPSTQALEISLSTLRFALKTKQIKKKIAQNFVSPEQSLIMQQKETIKMLQSQLMTLQQMTGVEIPLPISGSTSPSPSQATITTLTRVVEKAPSNEAIEKLKKQLQGKVDALSKLILHARFEEPKDQDSERSQGQYTRSVTISGFQDRYRRLQTLPENMQRQLYKQPARPADGVESSRTKSIAGALKYLRNINAMNQERSDIERKIQGEQGAELTRYDTVALEHTIAEDQLQHHEMGATRKKLAGLKLHNSQLVSRNNAYVAHINYLKGLFKKLGLSLLVTSTDVSQTGGGPSLSYGLATPNMEAVLQRKPVDSSLIDFLQDVQPLAYAMVSKLFCAAIDRAICNESKNSQMDTELSIENSRATLLRDLNVEAKVDSIFALLTPWEQHVLALLYEQQEVRTVVAKMTEKFTKDIADLQRKVHALLAEKVELVEHSTRLVEELREFRYDTIPKGEPAANEKFGRLLHRMDALSIEVTERSTEVKLLRADYDNLEKERDELQRTVEEMKDKLFTFDLDILPMDLASLNEDEDKRKLVKEVLFGRHLISETRIQLEECRTFENDLRKVNQQLWTELKSVQTALDTVRKEKKLVDFELKNERHALQKKFQESYDACAAAEAECARLRSQLASVVSERDNLIMNEKRRHDIEEQARRDAVDGSSGTLKSAGSLTTHLAVGPNSTRRRQSAFLASPIGLGGGNGSYGAQKRRSSILVMAPVIEKQQSATLTTLPIAPSGTASTPGSGDEASKPMLQDDKKSAAGSISRARPTLRQKPTAGRVGKSRGPTAPPRKPLAALSALGPTARGGSARPSMSVRTKPPAAPTAAALHVNGALLTPEVSGTRLLEASENDKSASSRKSINDILNRAKVGRSVVKRR